MATRKEAAEKKQALSAQISTLIRTLSLSVLAVAWLVLSGDKDAPAVLQLMPKTHLMAIGGLCVLAIALDLLQYIAGYYQVVGDLKAAKAKGEDVVVYSDSWPRWFAFRAKIFAAVAGATWLLVIIIAALIVQGARSAAEKSSDCAARAVIERQEIDIRF